MAPAAFFTGRTIRAHLGWRSYASSRLQRGQQASTSVGIAHGVRPEGAIRPNDRRPKFEEVHPIGNYARYSGIGRFYSGFSGIDTRQLSAHVFTSAYAGASAESAGFALCKSTSLMAPAAPPPSFAVDSASSSDSQRGNARGGARRWRAIWRRVCFSLSDRRKKEGGVA